MRSYRFARRSFLAGVGGAFGLEILLNNLEAAAQGATSPARFLMTHWPIGTYKNAFLPTGSGTSFTLSPMLKPFQPLLADTIILYGLTDTRLSCPDGGGHEAGTPFTTTGASGPGTRANNGEGDDGCAGGPSWDQIFLKNVPGLKQPGTGYINVLADARVDSQETSTRCLSYDYATRSIQGAASNAGRTITENTPLLPELSPSKAFASLFTGFMPGGVTPGNMNSAVNALKSRKSVLDYCLRELAQLKTLAPGSEKPKIEAHENAIRNVETQLSDQITKAQMMGTGGAGGGTSVPICTVPAAPDSTLVGKQGSKFDYDNPTTTTADQDTHEKIGKAHAAVLLAAFQCDIIRCATFQWSPGTNHVSFKGLLDDKGADIYGDAIYMHHPLSHKIGDGGFYDGPVQTGTDTNGKIYRFLCAVQTWYNQKMADILTTFKGAKDAFGNSILDYTVIPYVTEVGNPSHNRNNKASLIFGGAKLGMKGGQFMNFTSNRPQADVFLTAAQALFQRSDVLTALPTTEKFNRTGAGVINGLWAKP
ncbi:MAG TPA: DUF1552 domain-containing protein [Polyangiaceae bacterium]|nr:DUF1552 domain-containing protein [Polyangiaceae bacterium]